MAQLEFVMKATICLGRLDKKWKHTTYAGVCARTHASTPNFFLQALIRSDMNYHVCSPTTAKGRPNAAGHRLSYTQTLSSGVWGDGGVHACIAGLKLFLFWLQTLISHMWLCHSVSFTFASLFSSKHAYDVFFTQSNRFKLDLPLSHLTSTFELYPLLIRRSSIACMMMTKPNKTNHNLFQFTGKEKVYDYMLITCMKRKYSCKSIQTVLEIKKTSSGEMLRKLLRSKTKGTPVHYWPVSRDALLDAKTINENQYANL